MNEWLSEWMSKVNKVFATVNENMFCYNKKIIKLENSLLHLHPFKCWQQKKNIQVRWCYFIWKKIFSIHNECHWAVYCV